VEEFEPVNPGEPQAGMGNTANSAPGKKDKYLSGVFFAMFWSWMGGFVGLFVLQLVLMYTIPEFLDNSWLMVGTSVFHTAFTMLLFALFMPSSESCRHPVTARLNFKAALRFCIISCGIMFAGTFVGNGFSMVLEAFTGIRSENAVDEMINNMDFWPMLVAVAIVAPVLEELFFRKLLVDALSRYGTVFCCVVSGLVFGVFHGNFYQFFYAFGLGMLLAFIYCIYGKISYSIILHSIINFCGSVVPLSLGAVSEDNMVIMALYGVIYLALAITGLCFLVKDVKWFRCYVVESEVKNPFGKLVNGGFIATMIIGALLFVVYML